MKPEVHIFAANPVLAYFNGLHCEQAHFLDLLESFCRSGIYYIFFKKIYYKTIPIKMLSEYLAHHELLRWPVKILIRFKNFVFLVP